MHDYIIHLAVQYLKEGKTFNHFLENAMTAFVSEGELRRIWNAAWFSIAMTKKIKQKVMENLDK